ncbi:MAG: hypothetical protein FK733_01115 [Asgard group archaeon]|nr:hypothetical protein [Asgard group archaeon]
MKRKVKISLVLLLICSSFLLAQNTQGVFQLEIGDQVAFQIVAASHEITVSSTSDTFEGCFNDGTIISNGTIIVVEVTNVTTDELKYKTTNITPEITGTYPSDISTTVYFNFLVAVYLFLSDVDFVEIVSSGVIDPVYFNIFELPLFVDPKPQTWLDFAAIAPFIEGTLQSMFSTWDPLSVDATYSEVGDRMTMTLTFYASDVFDPTTSIVLENYSLFSYNMTTGVLIDAGNYFTTSGTYQSAAFLTTSNYGIEQTDLPDTRFNFLEFLSENKWYFIGGGGGVVLIITTVVVVSVIRKRNKSTKKGAKRKSSKKKSSKKKK